MANLSKIKRDQLLSEIDILQSKLDPSDNDSRSTLNKIRQEITNKKYGLVWEEHSEKVDEMLVDNIPVFTEDYEREICTLQDNKYNFILEGDNLYTLKLLEKTHKNKIDVIYIDPPYNTGNEDFIYNDSYVSAEDEYRHSLWLSFMKKRLKVAWRLLKQEGVIFISCDENEYANLKILCDTEFGYQNYIATYFWKKTDTPPSLSNKVRRKYEYILCFGKAVNSGHKFSQGLIDGGDAPLLNSGNPYKRITFPAGSVHFNIQDGIYTYAADQKIKLLEPVTVSNGVNVNEFNAEGTWKWNQETLNSEVSTGTYFIVKSKKFSIRYQRPVIDSVKIPQNNLNSEVGVGTNEESAKELELIFDEKDIFDYAKPTSLIKFLIKMTNKDNDITILDFFAGSGTTGQAVLELNVEDKGSRKFILATDNTKSINAIGDYLFTKGISHKRPSKSHHNEYKKWRQSVNSYYKGHINEFENNSEFELFGIAQRITYPRLKTILTGRRTNGSDFSNKIPNNLKYYKIKFISKNSEDISQILLGYIKELIQLEQGVKLDNKQYIMILSDEEADQLYSRWNDVKDTVKTLYVANNVLFTTEQKNLFEDVEIKIIPDNYFLFEMRESGEVV